MNDRKDYPILIVKKGEKDVDDFLKNTTPTERLEMMWPLTVQAWAFKGEDISEQRLQRHVGRLIKRKR